MGEMVKQVTKQKRAAGPSRKEQIVKVTLDIIGEYGFKGLTTAKIAEGVGISEAALYRHFKSKEEILSVAVNTIGQRLKMTIHEIMALDLSAPQKLEKIFMTHLDHIRTNRGVPRIIYTSEVHVEPDLRVKLHQIIENYLSTISALVEEGQAQKEVSAKLKPELVAARFLSMLQFSAFRYSLSNFSEAPVSEGLKLWKYFYQDLTSGM